MYMVNELLDTIVKTNHGIFIIVQQPQIVDRYFSESSDNVKLVNVTLRSALHLVRVSIYYIVK